MLKKNNENGFGVIEFLLSVVGIGVMIVMMIPSAISFSTAFNIEKSNASAVELSGEQADLAQKAFETFGSCVQDDQIDIVRATDDYSVNTDQTHMDCSQDGKSGSYFIVVNDSKGEIAFTQTRKIEVK